MEDGTAWTVPPKLPLRFFCNKSCMCLNARVTFQLSGREGGSLSSLEIAKEEFIRGGRATGQYHRITWTDSISV
jgi:hypothetical protein